MICENCGKEFFEDWRKDKKTPCRFCCRKCANTRQHSDKSKQKTSKSIKAFWDIKGRKGRKHKKYFYDENTEVGKFERSRMYIQRSKNLVKVGLDFSKPLSEEFARIKNELFQYYIIEKHSTLELNKKYGFSSCRTGSDLLKLFNIDVRSFKEAEKLGIEQGRKTVSEEISRSFHSGWHIDWQGNSHFLRSQLEFDLAEKLDSEKEEYQTEVPIAYFSTKLNNIKNGLPDFYLPNKKLFIETKGEYFLDRQDLEDRAKTINKMGCNFKVFVGDKKNVIIEEIKYEI